MCQFSFYLFFLKALPTKTKCATFTFCTPLTTRTRWTFSSASGMRKRSTGQNTSPPSLKTPAVPWVYLNLHGKIPLLDVNKYFGWQPETFLFYFVLRKFILYFYLLAAIDRKWYYEDLQVCGNNTSQVSIFWLFEIVRSTLVTELTFLIYQTA